MGIDKYEHEFKVSLHPKELVKPYHWKKPRLVFVNSMSDLFHNKVPDTFIKSVFDVMNECPRHIFQILTKREDRLLEISKQLNWTDNIWMGVSIENQDYVYRTNYLRKTKAKYKFLSLEPLIGQINKINLDLIDWVIIGGESGPHSRELKKEWVIDIRNKCKQEGISFFFKQWGGINKKKNGRLLNGKIYNEFPASIIDKFEFAKK